MLSACAGHAKNVRALSVDFWNIFIAGGVARYARRAREGVRLTAYCPAHPMDGSWPHGWARRTFLDGEISVALAGMSILSTARQHPVPDAHATHPAVYPRCALAVRLQNRNGLRRPTGPPYVGAIEEAFSSPLPYSGDEKLYRCVGWATRAQTTVERKWN